MNPQYFIDLDHRLLLLLNGSDSLYMDGVMMAITSTVTWIPLVLVLLYVIIHNNDMKKFFFIFLSLVLVILLADQFASGFCKSYFHRLRPSHNLTLMYALDLVNDYRGGKFGFISSHAANTFAVFTFLSLLIRNTKFSICLFIWAALSSYSRIYLGVHYPGDIFFGALSGLFWGALIYFGLFKRLVKIELDDANFISSQYTRSGFLISDINMLLSALWLTYVFILIKALWFI